MEDGTERPVGFASSSLNAAERFFRSWTRRYVAAILFALKKFNKQLYGRCFVIIPDHKPLVSLFSEPKQVPITASRRVQRWASALRGYEYKIHYKAGNADCLSRLPLPVTGKEEPEERVLLIEELGSWITF